eukprot:TRINITY_DN3646_c0_g1_i1.p1 TRINITY_DN3646_c0_g1~~TRINITY_DN3646_c0_g1_i1.p1  ORF type:complete len:149 (-),score=28.91 TRINITY_DN3646_c0_g1_i1:178-624(-)
MSLLTSVLCLALSLVVVLAKSSSSLKLNSTYCIATAYVDENGSETDYQILLEQNKDLGKNIFEGNYVDVATDVYSMMWCFYDVTKKGDEIFMSCFVQGEPLFTPGNAMLRFNKNGVVSFEELWYDGEPHYMAYDFKNCKPKSIQHPDM